MPRKSKKTGRKPKGRQAMKAAMADMQKTGKLWGKNKKGRRSKRAVRRHKGGGM